MISSYVASVLLLYSPPSHEITTPRIATTVCSSCTTNNPPTTTTKLTIKGKLNLLNQTIEFGCDVWFEGILVTGGGGKSVEMFVPSSGSTCLLGDLPDRRRFHTLEGGLLCGGGVAMFPPWPDTLGNCLTLDTTTGKWHESHNLTRHRGYHVSWSLHQDVILIGGYQGFSLSSSRTSELVRPDGTVQEMFALQYRTWYKASKMGNYIAFFSFSVFLLIYCRYACSIPNSDDSYSVKIWNLWLE